MDKDRNDYMYDDFFAAGTSRNKLLTVAEMIDKNTETTQCNFSDSEILHYTGSNGTDMYFAAFALDNPIKVTETKGKFVAVLQKNKTMSIMRFLRNGGYRIVKDFNEGKNLTVFDLASSFPDKPNGLMFVSDISKKTMLPRLTGKLTISEDYLERDLLLARIIGETQEEIIRYVIYRKTGCIRKMISMFTKNPNRISFKEVAIAGNGFDKKAKCEYWEISNRLGLEASFSYPIIDKAVGRIFANNKYRPIVTVATCDSGYAVDRIMLGWCSKASTEFTPLYTHEISVSHGEGDDVITAYRDAITESVSFFEKDARKMQEMKRQKIRVSEKDYKNLLQSLSKKCVIDVNAGLKAKAAFIQYAETENKGRTELDMIGLVFDATEKGVFASVSSYADAQVRKKGLAEMFA